MRGKFTTLIITILKQFTVLSQSPLLLPPPPNLSKVPMWSPINTLYRNSWASLVAQTVKNRPAMQETRVWSLGQEDSLEEEMETHCTILAWEILWTEEPGGLQSSGSERAVHNLALAARHACTHVYSYIPLLQEPALALPCCHLWSQLLHPTWPWPQVSPTPAFPVLSFHSSHWEPSPGESFRLIVGLGKEF